MSDSLPFRLCVPAILLACTAGLVVTARDGAQDKKGWGKEVTSSIGMRLVRIPAGTFLMGSPADEEWRDRGNEQQHEVEITRDYWLGVTEVTQKQFKTVMGFNPSYFSTDGAGRPDVAHDWPPAGGKEQVRSLRTDDFPVENVSHDEAVDFCRKLSALAAERKAGRTYRLPTEAEWEHACRGGTVSYQVFHVGSTLSSRQANFTDFRARLGRTCKVASYAPNCFGLFDMHGNVREWCADRYEAGYYAHSPRKDPQGPAEGASRVARGGSWSDFARHCRSARRTRYSPGVRSNRIGFRVVLVGGDR
jgi:formylglycine-generating enzyme required for sulfatase activity